MGSTEDIDSIINSLEIKKNRRIRIMANNKIINVDLLNDFD